MENSPFVCSLGWTKASRSVIDFRSCVRCAFETWTTRKSRELYLISHLRFCRLLWGAFGDCDSRDQKRAP